MANLGKLLALQLQSKLGSLSTSANSGLASVKDQLTQLVEVFGEKAMKVAVNGRGRSRHPILAYLLGHKPLGSKVKRSKKPKKAVAANPSMGKVARKKTKKQSSRKVGRKGSAKAAVVKQAAANTKKISDKDFVSFADTKNAMLEILRSRFSKGQKKFSTSDITQELKKAGVNFHASHPGVILSSSIKNLSKAKGRVAGSTRNVYIYTMESEPTVGKSRKKK